MENRIWENEGGVEIGIRRVIAMSMGQGRYWYHLEGHSLTIIF